MLGLRLRSATYLSVSYKNTGMSMNWKNKIWKYLTAFIVVLIILNPEMAQLAFFIDAVGLEVFLMLLEIQFLALLGMFFNTRIKPIFSSIVNLYSRYFLIFSWENIKEEPENVLLAVPSPATLMHMLVFLAAVGIILNVH